MGTWDAIVMAENGRMSVMDRRPVALASILMALLIQTTAIVWTISDLSSRVGQLERRAEVVRDKTNQLLQEQRKLGIKVGSLDTKLILLTDYFLPRRSSASTD